MAPPAVRLSPAEPPGDTVELGAPPSGTEAAAAGLGASRIKCHVSGCSRPLRERLLLSSARRHAPVAWLGPAELVETPGVVVPGVSHRRERFVRLRTCRSGVRLTPGALKRDGHFWAIGVSQRAPTVPELCPEVRERRGGRCDHRAPAGQRAPVRSPKPRRPLEQPTDSAWRRSPRPPQPLLGEDRDR